MAEKEYIERGAALDICEKYYQHCLEMHDWNGDSVADGIKTDIENLPSADVVEVVHGKWIKNGNRRTCSVCGFEYHTNGNSFNWCPMCLAKMDGKGDAE